MHAMYAGRIYEYNNRNTNSKDPKCEGLRQVDVFVDILMNKIIKVCKARVN